MISYVPDVAFKNREVPGCHFARKSGIRNAGDDFFTAKLNLVIEVSCRFQPALFKEK